MNILGYTSEGSLHRKLRMTRYKYRAALICSVVLGVIVVAAALIIPAHSNTTVVASANPVECVTPLNAGIAANTKVALDNEFDNAEKDRKANLSDFSKDTEWCRDEFALYVDQFDDWCFDTFQLTIDFRHTYNVGESVAVLADVSNIVNTFYSTGYVSSLKPGYSMGMYYNYEDAEYYATLVSDKTDDSCPWTHVTSKSADDVLQFCQKSVISTTSTNTVKQILSALVDSADYHTQEGISNAYAVSWQGTIDNQLLAPTFDTTADSYVTRVNFQSIGDVVYCIVTYIYENSTAGVTEESYSYTFTRSSKIMNWDIPAHVVDASIEDHSEFANILKEI